MITRGRHIFVVLMMAVTILSGCASQNSGSAGTKPEEGSTAQPPKQVSQEPITLKVAFQAYAEEEFDKYVVAPAKEKFPNITLEKVLMENSENKLQTLLASGDKPDILLVAGPDLNGLKDVGLQEDLQKLAKQQNLDLSRFAPNLLDSLKLFSAQDGLPAIPYLQNISALYYNKGLFDKFAASYPKDGITWEQARDLATRVTRMVDGVQYRGLEPDVIFRTGYQFGAQIIDAKKMKADVNSEKWQYVFQLMKSIYDIPGNGTPQWNMKGADAFIKDQTLAMFATKNMLDALGKAKNAPDWDIVTYPSYKNAPGIELAIDLHAAVITPTSKHQDAAFQIVKMMVTDDVQLQLSRNGEKPVIKSDNVEKEFGKNLPVLNGKNVPALFKTTPSIPPYSTVYEAAARKIVNDAMTSVVSGAKDVNTALRDADDAVNGAMKLQ